MSFITQKGATGALSLQANGTFQSSTDTNLATIVGTRWDLSDGREVILVSTDATHTASAGHLVQDPAITAGHQSLSVTTFTAYNGTTGTLAQVVVSPNAAVTANQYQGGFAIINSSTGIGQTLRVSSNTANTASAATIVFEDGPNTALVAAASTVCLIPPHAANVLESSTVSTPVGVALYPIAQSSYGFVTSKGIVATLGDVNPPVVGFSVMPSTATAGAVSGATPTGATMATIIGYGVQSGTSTQARAIFVNL